MKPARLPFAAIVGLVVLAAFVGSGCKKKEFKPGVYKLEAVFQTVKTADGEEQNRNQLRLVGGATFTFDYDGEFLVQYNGYGVGFERPCSGNYRGQYVVSPENQQVVLDAKRIHLPSYCRPSKDRRYTWDAGWGGSLTLERHWEGNQYILYRLEPME